jgi:hypothetical protein
MFAISKKHLSRELPTGCRRNDRTAFPESMVPAQTPLAKTAAAPTQRFGFLYVPRFEAKDSTPAKDGVGFNSAHPQTVGRFRDSECHHRLYNPENRATP